MSGSDNRFTITPVDDEFYVVDFDRYDDWTLPTFEQAAVLVADVRAGRRRP